MKSNRNGQTLKFIYLRMAMKHRSKGNRTIKTLIRHNYVHSHQGRNNNDKP